MHNTRKSTTLPSSSSTLNSQQKEKEKRDVSACVWMRWYVSNTFLELNVALTECYAGKEDDRCRSINKANLPVLERESQWNAHLPRIDFSEPGSSAASLVAECSSICVKSLLNVPKEKGASAEGSPFRVVFDSGKGADSTEKSRILFARVKVRGVHAESPTSLNSPSRVPQGSC